MGKFSWAKATRSVNRAHLFVFCLLLSLFFHVVMILSLPTKKPAETAQQSTLIQLVDMPQPLAQPRSELQPEYEIDQPPLPPEPELEVESPRRAARDQQVEREQAPEGDDVRDQRRVITPPPLPSPAPPPAPQPAPVPAAPAVTVPTPSAPPAVIEEPQQPLTSAEEIAREPARETEAPPEEVADEPPRLTREQLFPSPSRLAEIVDGQQAERDRIRERDNVEMGDEVWLNLQHDRLVSFFRRFHDRVERVWNYPVEAAMNGIDGTLELLIIVSQDGELIDVDLRRTSGSDLLDFEAIQAVYRAAPFGPLGRHYPHEQLRIRAYFQYRLSGRYIFGR